jgi:hypothetical protein
MPAASLSRLELWNKKACDGGQRLDVGGFVREASSITTVRSIDPSTIEQVTFAVPRSCEAAGVLREGQVARIRRGDSDVDEYVIGQYSIQRGAGALMTVTARAPYLRLAECGLVTQPGVDPLDGLPILTFTVSGTVEELITTYITDRDPADDLSDAIGALAAGTFEPTAEITLNVDYWTPLQFINACVDALADAAILAERRFTRNGSTNYLVGIYNSPT